MRYQSKVRAVLIVCTLLFLLNAAWLAWVQHAYRSEVHSLPRYQGYLAWRSLLVRPFSVAAMFVCWCVLAFAYFKPLRKSATEIERLAVLAMLLGSLYGFILLIVFKL